MTNQPVYKYFAFISYSRKDEAFAKKLQHFLTRFKLPSRLCKKYPDKPTNLRPIYRDKTDLIIDKLNDGITSGLQVSKYLIVICSEHSARPNEDGKNWVDDEVRFFAGLRPENEHRIIPVLLKRRKGLSVKNCMPPAIKELDILAADIQDKGESRVFSDVVAKMLELTPDELWNWVEREERKKRVFRRIGAGLAAVLAVASGIFAWDYNREKVDYYAYWAERDNYPVGIIKLDKEQVQGREFHYRFVSRGYKVRRVEMCNGHGNPINAVYKCLPESVAITEYMDYVDGKPQKVVCRAADGSLKLVKFYPDEHTITYQRPESGGDVGNKQCMMPVWTHTKETSLRGDYMFPDRITRCRVTREGGWIKTEMFQNEDGPRRNADGAWGRRFERDVLGRIESITYLNKEGKPAAVRENICSMRVKYTDDTHEVEEVSTHAEDGSLVADENGVALIQYKRPRPWLVEEYFLSADKKRVMNKAANVQAAGSIAGLTPYGQPKWKMSCDERGYTIPIANEGVSLIEVDYDEKGCVSELRNLTAQSDPVFNRNYEFMLNNAGVAVIRQKWEKNRLVREELFGLNRERVMHQQEGWSIKSIEYDNNGYVYKERFYGTDGKLCLNHKGYAVAEYTVEPKKSTTQFYTTDEKTLCVSVDGWARSVREIERDGSRITLIESYYGVDNKPCLNSMEVAQERVEIREEGGKVHRRSRYFGLKDGNFVPALCKHGMAGALQVYDEYGMEERRDYLGVSDDELVIFENQGVRAARISWQYGSNESADGVGRTVTRMFYGKDEKPLMQPAGYAGIQEKFDKNGRLRFFAYLGENGKLTHPPGRIAAWRREYDDNGRIEKEIFMDESGDPAIYFPSGCAGKQFVYDEAGRKMKEIFLNEQLKPCMTEMGYAISLYTYGEGRVQIEYQDLENRTVDSSLGHAYQDIVLDAHGNYASITYRNAAGESVSLSDGTFRKVYVYDKDGKKRRHTEFYDKEGKLLRREFE